MIQAGTILLARARRLNRFTRRTLSRATELSNQLKEILAELNLTKR